MLVFTDCTQKDGMTEADLGKAMPSWSAVLDERGLEVGIFHWYPIFGAGGERTFDFKQVSAFANHAAFGAFYEAMGNGGMYRQSEELVGPVMSCDVARVYNVKNRRFTQLRK